MTLDTINLLLGVAGLLLGLISAFGRIKAMTSRALRAGSDGAKRWFDRREKQNAMFAAHPSAFLAYLAKSFLTGIFVLIAWKAVGGILPRPLLSIVSFVAPAAIGTLMGAVSNRCAELLKLFGERQS